MTRQADLAIRCLNGDGPTVIFLPGYASDMTGTKAIALDAWAVRTGQAYVRFDYSGCGESSGRFTDQTLDSWLDDTLRIIDGTTGAVILIGSSMGGWLMLLAALARPNRIAALIGIAAAPDFTEWGFSAADKERLMHGQDIWQPSDYGAPMLTTARFWSSGQALCLPKGILPIDCPVRLLHGQRDADVPWWHATELAERLRSTDVQITLIKDGDHRLSRDKDTGMLIATIENLIAVTPSPKTGVE
jgi:pimeloyl-ACP methyl ester carboxylesterase